MRLLVLLLVLAASAVQAAPPPMPTSRDWRTWPFSRTSPWNMPIGRDAQYAAIPSPRSWSFGLVNYERKWASAVGVATTSDPMVDVLLNNNEAKSNHRFLETGAIRNCDNPATTESLIREWVATPTIPYFPLNSWSTTHVAQDSLWQFPTPPLFREALQHQRSRVHKPAGLCPSPDRDGHMAIFQPDGWVLDTYATVVLANGDIVSHRLATMVDARGDGTGTANGRRASMIPTFAGLVRDGEVSSGAIRHALSLSTAAWMLKRDVMWPATTFDRNSGYSGGLPMGALLAIPPSIDVERLGLTAQGVVFARALQQYGAYVVDRGGEGGMTVKWDTTLGVTGWPGMWTDQEIIRTNLRWVVNNSRNAVGGGGHRVAPLAPPFADEAAGRPHYDPPPQTKAMFVQAGADRAYVDQAANVWWHDQWFVGGFTVTRRTTPIAGTSDDEIYQTERTGSSGYRIPVPNGVYAVDLHFAETNPTVTAAGRRVMTARVEGQTATGIDPFRAVGRNHAMVRTFPAVTVNDGTLTIDLTQTAVEPTAINGIGIRPIAVPTLGITLSSSTTSGPAPLTTSLSVTPANCGTGCTYLWEFGNGATSTSRTPTHTYATPGLYTVLATVTGNGQVARAVIDITVR